ncbi:MAG: MaoC family dehydratase N-terminal domain-containing protein [Spirochaetes bacterium]|nr:MaoC family dehydratase N-terminal domain-containing protein [Spirochaetota bacterium]
MALDRKFIGKTYPSFTYDVSREKIREYARAIKSVDPHHFDETFAKQSRYGAIIAPPTFAVIFHACMIEPFFGDRELNIDMARIMHGEQSFEFFEPVRAGDYITTSLKIHDIQNKEKADLVTIEAASKNQHGRDVCRGLYTFLHRK